MGMAPSVLKRNLGPLSQAYECQCEGGDIRLWHTD